MPLTTTDVQQILETGILQAKLADATLAASLADTLAKSITPALNAVVGTQTGLIPTVQAVAPVMSITEALTVRDAIRQVIVQELGGIDTADQVAGDAAESLLIVGYVDVPKILAAAREDSIEPTTTSRPIPLTTGSHAASVGPGTVPSTH